MHTSWTGQNAAYEEAIESFTRGVLNPAKSRAFLSDFVGTCEPVFVAGALNSLTQSAIRVTAPGVPDIYQGTEFGDLSLVDPDNRRPVDFDRCQALQAKLDASPETLLANWRGGAAKMFVLQTGLRLRLDHQDLFTKGDYVPLRVEGPAAKHVLAFARVLGDRAAIVIVPRLALDLLHERDTPFVPPERWGKTIVRLPENIANRTFRDTFTGATVNAGTTIAVAENLKWFPAAILMREG